MVNKKYILDDNKRQELISIALSFPLDDILRYLLDIDKDKQNIEAVETLQTFNPAFKDRVEGTKIFIENHGIKTIEAYRTLKKLKTSIFVEKAIDTLRSTENEMKKSKASSMKKRFETHRS